MRKKTGYAVTTLGSKEEAESFMSKNVTTVLGYFENLEVGSPGASFLV